MKILSGANIFVAILATCTGMSLSSLCILCAVQLDCLNITYCVDTHTRQSISESEPSAFTITYVCLCSIDARSDARRDKNFRKISWLGLLVGWMTTFLVFFGLPWLYNWNQSDWSEQCTYSLITYENEANALIPKAIETFAYLRKHSMRKTFPINRLIHKGLYSLKLR